MTTPHLLVLSLLCLLLLLLLPLLLPSRPQLISFLQRRRSNSVFVAVNRLRSSFPQVFNKEQLSPLAQVSHNEQLSPIAQDVPCARRLTTRRVPALISQSLVMYGTFKFNVAAGFFDFICGRRGIAEASGTSMFMTS